MAEPAVQQGIELKLADGSVIKADTAEEALKIAAKMKEDTSAALKEEREKREALEAQVTQLNTQFQEAQRPKPVEGAFNTDQYWKLMNQDPVAAQNYIDAHRFNISDPSQVPKHFERINAELERMRGETMGAQFLQKHYDEFPATPEAAKVFRQRVQELNQSGYPFDIGTMDLAFSQLISEEKIKPLVKEPEKREEPNPSLSGAGATPIPDSEIAKAEQMSDKDLEKFLRSKGML